MPENEDRYPAESGRRRFVKGVVGASALGATGISTALATNLTTTSSGAGGGAVQYYGIENTDGPAPRGLPQIPIEVTGNGEIKGIWPEVKTETVNNEEVQLAEMQLGGTTYSSEWFQYCGVQTYPGIRPGADQSNFLRSGPQPSFEWQSELSPGDKLTVDMFDDYETWGNDVGTAGIGKPASATWRSQDLSPQETVPVQVMRSTRIEELAQNASDPAIREWLQASTSQGFIAWLNKCTHFCCVPGFKQTADFGAADAVYCPCHQSVYDPFSIVERQFTSLPRPEDTGSSSESGSGGGE
ncbi:ubiquinol-cytochrome c reductase iron-sulfur subunit [Halococcus sp. PRR34]|uniref:ubiquinol-cytochrome c reductase iron-sulfur subunit n=1 Tax=Halococcus sp. PRR34 TaxID=3020830 RepID=UPI00235F1B25|nr:ubiquinol-cytochrome c reductase iron-sulfur subunit [Halococcus sp. PRR34]